MSAIMGDMTQPQGIFHAIDALLNEGVNPSTIRSVLRPLDLIPTADLRTLIDDRAAIWLANAEQQMKDYAAEESWTRLGLLLAKYQQVVVK